MKVGTRSVCFDADTKPRLDPPAYGTTAVLGSGSADLGGAFATLVDGLSGCAWAYESESQ